MQYCSLLHQTLLPSPVTSTTGHCFPFGSISSFFLELFLHSSPVAYWAPINPGRSSFSVISFCLFILFMGFSRQEYWSGLPCPPLAIFLTCGLNPRLLCLLHWQVGSLPLSHLGIPIQMTERVFLSCFLSFFKKVDGRQFNVALVSSIFLSYHPIIRLHPQGHYMSQDGY